MPSKDAVIWAGLTVSQIAMIAYGGAFAILLICVTYAATRAVQQRLQLQLQNSSGKSLEKGSSVPLELKRVHTNNEYVNASRMLIMQKTVPMDKIHGRNSTFPNLPDTVSLQVGAHSEDFFDPNSSLDTNMYNHRPREIQTCGHCCCVWLANLARRMGVYGAVILHIWDQATDVGVLVDWWLLSTEPQLRLGVLNTFWLFVASLVFILMYRIVSAVSIFRTFATDSKKNTYAWKMSVLQFLDLLLFVEVYYASKNDIVRATPTLRLIRSLESVFESMPQTILQILYMLDTGSPSLLIYASAGLSMYSIASSVMRADEFTFNREANRKCPPSGAFLSRAALRIFEILARFLTVVFLWQATNFIVVLILISVEAGFYWYFWKAGLLGEFQTNIFNILIAHPNISFKHSLKYSEMSRPLLIISTLFGWYPLTLLFSLGNQKGNNINLVTVHYIHRFLETSIELTLVYFLFLQKSANTLRWVVYVVAVESAVATVLFYVRARKSITSDGKNVEMNVFGYIRSTASNKKYDWLQQYLVRTDGKQLRKARGENDITPLMQAVICEDLFIVNFIVDYYMKYAEVNAQDRYGRTALHYCAKNGCVDIAEVLLKNGARTNFRNETNHIPFQSAVACDQVEMFRWFMEDWVQDGGKEAGDPSPLEVGANDGEFSSVAHIAVTYGSPNILAIMYSEYYDDIDFDCYTCYIITKKGEKKCFMEIAIENNWVNVVEAMYKQCGPPMQLGGDVSFRDPVMLSTQLGYAKILEFWCKTGARLNFKDPNDRTPLMIAILHDNRKCRRQMVRVLLEGGANVGEVDNRLETPLFHAMRQCDVKVVKMLHAHGADFEWENIAEETPSDVLSQTKISKAKIKCLRFVGEVQLSGTSSPGRLKLESEQLSRVNASHFYEDIEDEQKS